MDNNCKPLKSDNLDATGKAVAIALNAVPGIGGVLSGIANEIISTRQNKRLNRFLIDLATDMTNLSERINKDFIKTEEFADLAEDIFSKATETRQQEKLDAFKAIFLNTVLIDHPNYDKAAEITELIQRWQPRHIVMLKILSDPQKADIERGCIVGTRGGGYGTSFIAILRSLLPEWDEEQIDRTWQDLYDDKIHTSGSTRTMITDTGIRQLENRLTSYGKCIIKFITNPN